MDSNGGAPFARSRADVELVVFTRRVRSWAVRVLAIAAVVAGGAGSIGGVSDGAVSALAGIALLFSLAHASLTVGWRATGAFFLISYAVAFVLEATSVAVGFPFGAFEHHTGGPRLVGIPLVVPLAYFAYGWIAWTLATVITRPGPARRHRFATPVVAALILTGWDVTFDPIYATVNRQYSYDDPGGLFGVPVSNFLGWLLTGWIILQLFALVVQKAHPPVDRGSAVAASAVWMAPILPLLGYVLSPPTGEVAVAGRTFVAADVHGAAFVLSLMTLGLTGILALIRVLEEPGPDAERQWRE